MHPLRVMLIYESSGRGAILEQALHDAGHTVVARMTIDADPAVRLREVLPDVIVIDRKSPDRDLLERLSGLDRDRPRPVVLLAEHSDGETIDAAIRAGVSACVIGEADVARRLPSIMEVAIARFRERQALRRELEEARSRLAERKVIEKAKGLLMQRKGLTEEQAYRMLRKLAMDRNQRLAEVAGAVISVMELLA